MRAYSYDFQSLREQFDTTTAAGENPTNGQQVDPRLIMVMDIPVWGMVQSQVTLQTILASYKVLCVRHEAPLLVAGLWVLSPFQC